ncbi:transposase, partial [Paracidovorax avenae]|uniref:transposase n=1 Tax=Paracidovorax avenae TaxID=80867 RepID=UPI001F1C79AA
MDSRNRLLEYTKNIERGKIIRCHTPNEDRLDLMVIELNQKDEQCYALLKEGLQNPAADWRVKRAAGKMASMTQEQQQMLGFDPLPKKTRKEIFLEEMNRVVPWAALVALIQPHARGAHQALGGRPPFAVETMLRIHCLQLWWNLSDPAMEEELHERPL